MLNHECARSSCAVVLAFLPACSLSDHRCARWMASVRLFFFIFFVISARKGPAQYHAFCAYSHFRLPTCQLDFNFFHLVLPFGPIPSPPRHHQPPSRRSRSVVIFPLPTYAVFCRTSLAPSHQGIDPCTATHQLPYPGLANIVTSKFGRRTAYP